jgi:hypothetical protein
MATRKTILTLVDVVGALANDTLSNNVYMLDNNASKGSTGEGSERLKTQVKRGDQLIWLIQAIEPESFVTIADIIIDKAYCEPVEQAYEGTDITFWSATVKKVPETNLPYQIKMKMGNRDHELVTPQTPFLIGA